MTTLTLYNSSITPLDSWMDNLAHILQMGQAYGAEQGWKDDALLQARLYPNMLTLIGQVQVATSLVKACPHRLAGQEPPKWEDGDDSFDALFARIERAKAELAIYDPDQINGRETESFDVRFGPTPRSFTGLSYASSFILPNVLFHITTVYNILRHNGVPLGKFDFFGGKDKATA